jgi:C4-dicarboxylate-specific signal transduction histidine kinase
LIERNAGLELENFISVARENQRLLEELGIGDIDFYVENARAKVLDYGENREIPGANLFVINSNNNYLGFRPSPDDLVLIKKPGIWEWQLGIAVDSLYLESFYRDSVKTATTLLLLMLIAVTIIVFLLARLITRPIADLSLSARRLSDGDLSSRARVFSRDELGGLARVFNAMAENQQALTDSLEQKVSERTKQLEQSMIDLKKAQDLLIQRERMSNLGRLVGGIAHEMNTPLGIGITSTTFLQNLIQDIEKKFRESSLTRSDLAQIIDNAKGSIDLVYNNLQKTSSIIASFKELALEENKDEMRSFSIKECCNLVLGATSEKAAQAGVIVEILEVPEGTIEGYPESLFQVFTILIRNSLEHAFPGERPGKIELAARLNKDMIELICRDNGIGLDPEIVDRIYEPFIASSEKSMGSGLGLNIVYNIVNQRLGGTITHREPESGGLEFKIRIPVK